MFFLILLIIIFFIFTFWTVLVGAGWEPTPMPVVYRMLSLAEVKPGDVVYDLGCGDGRVIITAVCKFGAQAVGIEIDPLRYFITRIRIRRRRLDSKIQLVWGNFIQQDLRSATVVGIFLSSRANSRLEEKFSQELRPGTRIVSYYWPMKKWNPKFVDYENRIYLYQVPEEFSATD